MQVGQHIAAHQRLFEAALLGYTHGHVSVMRTTSVCFRSRQALLRKIRFE